MPNSAREIFASLLFHENKAALFVVLFFFILKIEERVANFWHVKILAETACYKVSTVLDCFNLGLSWLSSSLTFRYMIVGAL